MKEPLPQHPGDRLKQFPSFRPFSSSQLPASNFQPGSRQAASALIIILAFVVMLLVLLMAFFSKSTLQQQISKASSSYAVVDVFAEGAVETIIGDLKQEIAAGSVISTNLTTNITSGAVVTNYIYYPATNLSAVPAISGFTTNVGLENIVKISRYGSNFFTNNTIYTNITTYPPANRAAFASPLGSTTNPSLNGRSISLARWNDPLLMAPTDTNNFAPSSPNFTAPDWILLGRDGSNIQPSTTNLASSNTWSATNTSTVIGRYAYVIYDEGGLIDINVAGYPPAAGSSILTNAASYKSALSYADLTQLTNAGGPLLSNSTIVNLLNWRNAATAQSNIAGTFGITNYIATIAGTTNGFLRTSTNTYVTGIQTNTDRMFISREQLISFFNNQLGATNNANLLNALRYLGTFSRDISQPSYAPNTNRPVISGAASGGNSANGKDLTINPSFLSIRVANSFTRNDGTPAVIGEPLVKKRFALNRLAWLTYGGTEIQGPSALRSHVSSPAYGANGADNDLYALENTYGMSVAWLQQGTVANIHSYFGLTWNAAGYWIYDTALLNVGGFICNLSDVAALTGANAREPNFIELLKAAILAGSIAKDWPLDPSDRGYANVDVAIMQIAANIIAQSTCDGYPPQIQLTEGGTTYSLYGVKNLPYLYRTRTAALTTSGVLALVAAGGDKQMYLTNQATNVGTGGQITAMIQPEVWNPHGWNPYDTNSNYGLGNPAPTNFRIAALPSTVAMAGVSQFTDNTSITNSLNTTTSATNILTFSIPSSSGGASLFREPTLLITPNVPSGSNLQGTGPSSVTALGVPLSYRTNASTTEYPSGVGIGNSTPMLGFTLGTCPLAWINAVNTNDASVANRIVINPSGTALVLYTVQYANAAGSWFTYDYKISGVYSGQTRYLRDGTTPAITNAAAQPFTFLGYTTVSTATTNNMDSYVDNMIPAENSASVCDPRTDRFGFQMNNDGSYGVTEFNNMDNDPAPRRYDLTNSSLRWGSPTQNVTETERPNEHAGYHVINAQANNYGGSSYPPLNSAGWNWGGGTLGTNSALSHGLLSQNLMTLNDDGVVYISPVQSYSNGYSHTPQYFQDADGVVRRGMAGHNQSLTNRIGLPLATAVNYSSFAATTSTPSSNSTTATPTGAQVHVDCYTSGAANDTSAMGMLYSRPVVLNRPFQTVGELAYTFSDIPWRNLDLSSPESGFSGLLDVFCIQDTTTPNSLVAGKINLNTRQQPVLNAVLAGAYEDTYSFPTQQSANGTSLIPLSASIASGISSQLMARTGNTNTASSLGPLQNLSELVGRQIKTGLAVPIDGTSTNNYDGFSGSDLDALYSNNVTDINFNNIERFREAPIRALAAVGTTRVWNLMIDVIAQSGRYPTSATALNQFMVEGEQRYWVHLAIDRLTGQVIDKQIEVIKE